MKGSEFFNVHINNIKTHQIIKNNETTPMKLRNGNKETKWRIIMAEVCVNYIIFLSFSFCLTSCTIALYWYRHVLILLTILISHLYYTVTYV